VKPEITKHETLFDLEQELKMPVRFMWIALFTVCDRFGQFPWRPRALKAELLPFDDDCDIEVILESFLSAGMVIKYRVREQWYGLIPSWAEHQSINNREKPVGLPSPDVADQMVGPGVTVYLDAKATRDSRVNDASESREREGSESLDPGKDSARMEKEKEKEKENKAPAPSARPPANSKSRGTRLTEKWLPDQETAQRIVDRHGITVSQLESEFMDFRDYFLSAAGRNATKVDWNRSFALWVSRSAKDGKLVPPGGAAGRTLDELNAEWLRKATDKSWAR